MVDLKLIFNDLQQLAITLQQGQEVRRNLEQFRPREPQLTNKVIFNFFQMFVFAHFSQILAYGYVLHILKADIMCVLKIHIM